MFTTIIAFLLGVFLAPAIRPLFRPVLVEMIRGGLVLTDEVTRASASLGESMEDARAEATAVRAAADAARSSSTNAPAGEAGDDAEPEGDEKEGEAEASAGHAAEDDGDAEPDASASATDA